MKKTLLILVAVASVWTLGACSSDSEPVDEVTIDPETGAEVIHTPVEIKLGVPSTRAAITTDTTDITLGIFALARCPQDINQRASAITWWGTTDPDSAWSFCLMKNVPGLKHNNDITWDGKYWYPMTQFYAYDFYAYYPFVPTANIDTTTVDLVEVGYELDGMTDIIWGRATAPHVDSTSAFSAKWIREGHTIPQVTLNHMLTRLRFSIAPGSSRTDIEDYTEAAKMVVDSLKILNVQKNVTMTIASRGNDNGMTPSQRLRRNGTEKQDLYLKDADGMYAHSVQVPDTVPAANNRLYFGESFLLYPEEEYLIRIWFHSTDNPTYIFRTEHPLVISTGGSTPFQQGKSYTIQLVIHGAQEIELRATLTPWDELDAVTIEL